jgi:alanyl-tRNA synthetase
MTLNPITALSEQLQKLITEHGSAAILRDHLALFKDQVVILEKKAALLESENAVLKTENGNLKTRTQQLTEENEELRRKIQSYDQPTHCNLLDEAKINILKLLFKQDKLVTQQIAQSLNFEIQTAKFHLEELKVNNMLSHNLTRDKLGSPMMTWSLAQEGRRYLIENKLTS